MVANYQAQEEVAMKGPSTRTIGLLAIMIGISILVRFVSYMLNTRIFNGAPLLIISAFVLTAGALLNMMLAWMFYLNFREQSPKFNMYGLITGLIGSFIVFFSSALDLLIATLGYSFDSFPLSQTRSIMVFGYTFIGLWLLLLNYYAWLHGTWSSHLAWFGMIAGAIIMMGILAAPRIFVPYVSLYHNPVPEFGELLGNLGWMFLYPIWSIWIGSIVLSNSSNINQHNNLISNTR